jgi:hypothetical protein
MLEGNQIQADIAWLKLRISAMSACDKIDIVEMRGND